MMRSEVLAEKLYREYLDSAEPSNISLSTNSPPSWFSLGHDGRSRWRKVAEAALSFNSEVEDWHGKTWTSQ
jgi:hypothetical protein